MSQVRFSRTYVEERLLLMYKKQLAASLYSLITICTVGSFSMFYASQVAHSATFASRSAF